MMKKIIVFIFLFIVSLSFPLVHHPGGEPDASWTDRPFDSVTAKAGSCSAVIIHPQYILTVSHCPVSLGTQIKANGSVYYPKKISSHPIQDLQLVKVDGADFEHFSNIPEEDYLSEEGDLDFTLVLGGYGKIRGNNVYATYDPNILVGYTWGTEYGDLKWGTNETYGYNKNAIYVTFGIPDSTPYECGLSTYDSGCGAFLYRNGEWWVVGLGRSVGDAGYDYFKHPFDPDRTYSGTLNVFIRTHHMKGWVESIIYGADMNKDNYVDLEDLTLFMEDWLIVDAYYNSRSDLNQDGRVDMKDYSIFSSQWLK